MSDGNLHPVMQGVFAQHFPEPDAGDVALRLLVELISFVDRNDTDDLDFGRGFASTGLIDRARKLVSAEIARQTLRQIQALTPAQWAQFKTVQEAALACQAGGEMSREELTDIISDAIGDSMDAGWNYATGARYVIEALVKEGVITFDEAAQ